MRRVVMRPDLIAMGTIAALTGIALAALLTVSFGARSSGPPAALRPAQVPRPAETTKTQAAATPLVKRNRAPEKTRHKRRRQLRASAPAPSPPVAPVAAEPKPVTTPQTTPSPQRTQPVVAPAPDPQPVRPLGRPKSGGSGGGGSFDDSG